jgi:hypothetical protein
VIMDNLWFGVCSRWIRESIHLRVMKWDSLSSCLSGVGDMDFDVDLLFVLDRDCSKRICGCGSLIICRIVNI